MGPNERRALARRVAELAALDLGVAFDDGSIIKDSNNTVVGVNAELVAKVATTTTSERVDAIERETLVLTHLGGSDAPTSRLAPRIPAGPHLVEGCRVILLERLNELDQPPGTERALEALHATHLALSDLTTVELPSFLDGLTVAEAIFAAAHRSPALPATERRFCLRAAVQLGAAFEKLQWHDVVVHGDPWIGGNLISTIHGPRLIDFEATCRGPLEWDLSSLGEIADQASEADPGVLSACRLLRSFTVAAWCWTQPDRAPEVREAAHWHLELLHRGLG